MSGPPSVSGPGGETASSQLSLRLVLCQPRPWALCLDRSWSLLSLALASTQSSRTQTEAELFLKSAQPALLNQL